MPIFIQREMRVDPTLGRRITLVCEEPVDQDAANQVHREFDLMFDRLVHAGAIERDFFPTLNLEI